MIKKLPTDFYRMWNGFSTSYLNNERNVSQNTISSYRYTFKLYIKFMYVRKKIRADRIKLIHLTRTNVLDFLDWLESDRKCSESTRNQRLAAIRSFVLYLQYEDVDNAYEWQKILTIKNKRHQKPVVNYLDADAMRLLLEQPDTTTAKGIRELALLSLIYDTGARVSEITQLTPADLKLAKDQACVILNGKGRKARYAIMLPKQVDILRKYMKIYKLDLPENAHRPLFSNVHGKPLTRAGVNYLLQKNLTEARKSNPDKIPSKLTPHSLRHTKAMHLLEAGWQLVEIRDFLGHVSIQTTGIYARANKQAQDKALGKVYQDITPETDQTEQWVNEYDMLDELLH